MCSLRVRRGEQHREPDLHRACRRRPRYSDPTASRTPTSSPRSKPRTRGEGRASPGSHIPDPRLSNRIRRPIRAMRRNAAAILGCSHASSTWLPHSGTRTMSSEPGSDDLIRERELHRTGRSACYWPLEHDHQYPARCAATVPAWASTAPPVGALDNRYAQPRGIASWPAPKCPSVARGPERGR